MYGPAGSIRSSQTLFSEAAPTITSSTQIFANCPIGCDFIRLTVRTATITMTSDGKTATSSVGIDYATGTYEIPVGSRQAALLYRAISGSGTGYIEYCASTARNRKENTAV